MNWISVEEYYPGKGVGECVVEFSDKSRGIHDARKTDFTGTFQSADKRKIYVVNWFPINPAPTRF